MTTRLRDRGAAHRLARAEGFTLIELLVVLVIIGLLATLVAPNFIGQSEKAKPKAARAQLQNFSNALDMYQLDVGRYPTSEEGLNALVQRRILNDQVPADPWGRPYFYRSPGAGGAAFDVGSLGADGREGGDGNNADVVVSR